MTSGSSLPSPRSPNPIGSEEGGGAKEDIPSSAHPDYDSDTMRRAAAKNREVSKKLFSRLQVFSNYFSLSTTL